ncbi:MAG: beta-N-acetylglucosaminidase domain-containing protein [Solirubrobacteraceae bacterium]
MRARRLPPALTVAAGLILASACPASSASSTPEVSPVPQSMRLRPEVVRVPQTVTVVTGEATDASALAVVRDVLRRAGVPTIRQIEDPGSTGPDRLTVYLDESAATAGALRALGAGGAEGIAPEGYVLAVGNGADGRSRIVLDGVDASGTYYAAQTLRQLVRKSPGSASLRGVEIRDWPSLRRRGVVEGFYGPPWSHEVRLDQLDYYGRHKMNLYVYTPKDDPYLRAEWRRPYPDDELARIGALVARAKRNHVEFSYVLSPGLSVCFSEASEADALIAKFESLWSIGVRSFVVAFDDIDYQRWHCEEDRETFGSGPAAAASAQARLVNRVQREFVATRPGTEPLQVVPTEYWGTARTGYTNVIATDLDRDVVVQWTGMDVIAPTITRADVAAAREVFGHPIQLWDNYPVNDYVPSRLLLGPFLGREPGLSASAIGLTANPMPQAEASKTSLFNVADYAWNDVAYDPAKSWAAGLAELAGGDAGTAAALRAFADVNRSSRLDPRPGPELSAEIDRFWPAWSTGHSAAAKPLRRALRQVHDAPDVLRARLDNPGFLAETEPWLDATRAWGQAGLVALDMLVAQRAGRGEEAWADRRALPGLIAHARSFTWVGLDATREIRVELDPALEEFVRDALGESTRWLGVTEVSPLTNLPLLDDRFPTANMTDGDSDTYFWGAAPAQPGHYVGVDLGKVRPVTGVDALMAKSDSPDDYIHSGVVEYSSDGTTWTSGPEFAGASEVRVDLPAGTTARFVRLRATQPQGNWVVVRELTVRRGDMAVVSGVPEPAADGALARAADGDLATEYEAARAPAAGEALTVTLPTARPLHELLVLQQGGTPAGADVQVRTGDGAEARWVGIGRLSGGSYTALRARGLVATAVRLVWAAGSPPPVVAEILPAYDDEPPAAITLAPATLDLDSGAGAAVTAMVAATRADDQAVKLEAAAPAGITVTPASRTFVLSRGARAAVTLQVEAATGLPTGTYRVPVTVRSGHQTVTATLTVAVWPRTATTNVALASNGAVATASSVEDDLPQFTADRAIDGDASTRWSSPWTDDQWLQVELANPQRVGRVVLRWETAHASRYEILTSPDGTRWTTAATVPVSQGGTESLRLDAPDTRYVRMHGLGRATQFGYSLYELEVYPVAP